MGSKRMRNFGCHSLRGTFIFSSFPPETPPHTPNAGMRKIPSWLWGDGGVDAKSVGNHTISWKDVSTLQGNGLCQSVVLNSSHTRPLESHLHGRKQNKTRHIVNSGFKDVYKNTIFCTKKENREQWGKMLAQSRDTGTRKLNFNHKIIEYSPSPTYSHQDSSTMTVDAGKGLKKKS